MSVNDADSEETHECPTCGDSFTTRSGLGVHHSRMHGERLIHVEERMSKDIDCPSCNRAFDSEQGMRTHHTTVHDERLGYVTKVCDTCGDEFKVHENRTDDFNNCSQECSKTTREVVKCDNCGASLERAPWEIERNTYHFCDERCRYEGASNWKSGESKVDVECEICETDLKRWPFEVEQSKDGFVCSDECFSKLTSRRTGQDHPNWVGGGRLIRVVKQQLPTPWQTARRRSREKTDHKCAMCGGEPAERKLDVHHIIPVLSGGTNEDWNLIALCRSCHMTAEWVSRDVAPAIIKE